MEKEIKRMNFFDGQFLKESEFQDEQYYYLHMRRRINYLLFENSGVIHVNPDDLNIEITDRANRIFRVTPGMAISRNDNEKECKEIILREEAPVSERTKNLNDEGITAGQIAYITIHYDENKVNDPPSEGDVAGDTRVKEISVIGVHSTKPIGPAPNGEEYIYLGAISFDDIPDPAYNPDYSNRDEAKIRASLLGAAPVSLASIALTSASSTVLIGNSLQFTATGTRSDNSTIDLTNTVTWSSDDETIATVNASGLVTGVAEGSATITAEAQGITGTATVIVSIVAPTLVSIEITPNPSVVNVGKVIQLTATGTYSNSSTNDITSAATWTSSDDTIASVNASGLITGVAEGSATITAEAQGITGTTTVEVQPIVEQPVIAFLSPDRQPSGLTIDIHGENIWNPPLTTTIRFMKGLDAKDGLNLTVRPIDAGRQVLRITVPDRSGTTWSEKEWVILELKIDNLTATKPFRYDD